MSNAQAATTVDRAVHAVATDDLVELVRLLVDTPSPPGGEAPLARELAAWGRARAPSVSWEVDEFAAGRANLISRSPSTGQPALALYGHLDTSLTGDAERDAAITGRADNVPGFAHENRWLSGPGLAVAKGPSAAALIGYLAAASSLASNEAEHGLAVLLAAGGTHRSGGFGVGVRHALASGFRPGAVVNVKGGAPGVLHEEPGSAYLQVRVRGQWGAVLHRGVAAPEGGVLAYTGAVVTAIEKWRDIFVASPLPPTAQIGREAGIGAITGGDPDKRDLFPAVVHIFVYAVVGPGDQAGEVAASLEAAVRAAVPRLDVSVQVDAWEPWGATAPDASLVRLAREAWAAHGGVLRDVRNWTGSTDGVIFRNAGIETVRVGPVAVPDPTDPRCDRIAVGELVAAARAYAAIGVGFVMGNDGRG